MLQETRIDESVNMPKVTQNWTKHNKGVYPYYRNHYFIYFLSCGPRSGFGGVCVGVCVSLLDINAG